MHPLIALKAFFLTLFNGALARQVDEMLRRRHEQSKLVDRETADRTADTAVARKPAVAPKPTAPPKPKRSEAITLLAALQREGRFVDFLKEELTGYSDAQIGAVARDLHRDCAKVAERIFSIKPLLSEGEGASIEVPAGFDAARYRLVGNISGSPPFRGALVHHGWQATICELPEWVGGEESARVIAPAEVEMR